MSRKHSKYSRTSERHANERRATGNVNSGHCHCGSCGGETGRPGNHRWRDSKKDPKYEEVCQGIDDAAIEAGLILADLFKTVSLAAAFLPEMEMHTGSFSVVTDEDSITVCISGLGEQSGGTDKSKQHWTREDAGNHKGNFSNRSVGMKDPGYEDSFWQTDDEEEEERLYDEY